MEWPQIALDLLTTVPAIVAKVEAANPTTPGADKKLKVMDEIQTALTEAEPLVGQFLASQPEILAIFSVAVDASVDLFNRTTTVLANAAATVPPAKLITGAPAIAPQAQGSGVNAGTAVAPANPGGARTGA